MKQLVLLLLLILFVSADTVAEDGGSGGFQLLNRPAGVAAVGRGYSGVTSQGTFARYYNPAMYSAIDKQHISFELMRRMSISDLQSTQFELGFSVRNVFFAFEASNQTVGNIYLTDELPGGFPDESAATSWQFSQFSLTVGMRSDENLNWGFTFGTAFDRFDGEVAYALLFGAGITYDLFDHTLKLGASAINWGLTTPMWGEGDETFGHGEALPSTLRLGATYTHFLGQVRLMGTADVVYTHVFETRDSVSGSGANRFSVPLGVEVSPIDWATIRMGKRINGGSDVINFGLGFIADWIETDISFVIHKYGGTTELEWMAGVTLSLAHKKSTESQKILIDEPVIVTPLDSSVDSTVIDSLVQKDSISTVDSVTNVDTIATSSDSIVITDQVISVLPSEDSLSVAPDVLEENSSKSSQIEEEEPLRNETPSTIDTEQEVTPQAPTTSSPQNIDEELDLIE